MSKIAPSVRSDTDEKKFPRQNLKVLDRIVERGATEQLDQLGFCLPENFGARIHDSRHGKRSRLGLSSWLIGGIGPRVSDREPAGTKIGGAFGLGAGPAG